MLTSAVHSEVAIHGLKHSWKTPCSIMYHVKRPIQCRRLRSGKSNSSSTTAAVSTVLPMRTTPGILPRSTATPAGQQLQQHQQHYYTSAPKALLPIPHWQQQQQQQDSTTAAATTGLTTPTIPAPAVGLLAGIATLGERQMLHIHLPFAAFFGYLGLMAAAAVSSDWYLDVAAFGAIWAGLWAVCCRWQPSTRTVVLFNLLPLLHLSGALGTYHWELGNLSWDILVHISNGFIGTLLFASILTDLTTSPAASSSRSGSSSSGSGSGDMPSYKSAWRATAWQFAQLSVLLIAGTSIIEVVEGFGGQVAGVGEGIFLRGAGDFCTVSVPCSEEVDTAKDMVDNVAGMLMALVALGTTTSRGSRLH